VLFFSFFFLVRSLLEKAWAEDPAIRPSAAQLCEQLETLIKQQP
jgi:hypothetical protein